MPKQMCLRLWSDAKIPTMAMLHFSILLTASLTTAFGQTAPLSERMADTAMNTLWRDATKNESGTPAKWTYDHGLVLKGIEGVWHSTGDGRYFNYIKQSMDQYVNPDGTIRTYKLDDYSLDNVLNGRVLLLLYKVTSQEKYRNAAALLREQLKTHPR